LKARTWPHVTEAGRPLLIAAVDGIDQAMPTTRDVVFAPAPRTASSEATTGAGYTRDDPGAGGFDDRP
jgi:hypothetical protein